MELVLFTLIAITVVLGVFAFRLRDKSAPPLTDATAAIEEFNFAGLASLLDRNEFVFLQEQLSIFQLWRIHASRMRVALLYLNDLDRRMHVLGDAIGGLDGAERVAAEIPRVRLILLRLKLRALVSIVLPGTQASARRLLDVRSEVMSWLGEPLRQNLQNGSIGL